jgi:tetratricopeptide (TPR) repeat protein
LIYVLKRCKLGLNYFHILSGGVGQMKAFLSYSSKDVEFVRAIAEILHRQYCLYDEKAFATGIEFKQSIENGLSESSVFVLFASKNSLDSIWVQFEANEAWYQRLKNKLSNSLVYLIDSSIEIDNLPEWLKRALVRRFNSPQLIARDIRYHLDEVLRDRQNKYLTGRSYDTQVIEQALTPLGDLPPHSFFVSGLPGIGRRTLVKHVTPSLLQLRKFVEIRVGEGDTITDICSNIADRTEPYNTIKGLEHIVNEIRGLSEEQALKRIIRNLVSLVSSGELPILVDDGGFMDEEGRLFEHIQKLIGMIQTSNDVNVSFVSWRRPTTDIERLPVIPIKPLGFPETKHLLKLLANNKELKISIEQIDDLAEYVAGYPPAAFYAIQQAKDYGIDLVLRDKVSLVRFTSSIFLRHFAKLGLTDHEKKVLTLLASFSPLPLKIITDHSRLDPAELDALLIRLIDLALIIVTENGYYRISDPIADASIKAFGYLNKNDNTELAKLISSYLDSETNVPQLELSKLMFKAASISGNLEIASRAVYLANDLIKLTETLYHQHRYSDAIQTGYLASKERPDSITARRFLIRALIQEENWTEAEKQIVIFKKYAPTREIFYLLGFLERRRNNIPQALNNYTEAKRLGWTGSAINRELAQCHFLLHDYDNAAKNIEEAIAIRSDDRYLVDLKVQIAIERHDQKTAKEALQTLESIDEPAFYLHRLSCYERIFGMPEKALDDAQKAFNSLESPPFEILAQLSICQIELGQLHEARVSLALMNKSFPRIRSDVRYSIMCKLENAEGNFSEALRISQFIVNKKSDIYKKIRRDALHGELSVSALSDETRIEYQKELDILQEEIDKNIFEEIMLTIIQSE